MKKILVIEDEPIVRSNILELLEGEDYDAVGAENGVIGAMSAREHLPDLIICDVMMPELDGYGVLTALRQDPATATIPFIFLTAKADKVDLRQGMELGADDYLTKPFTADELLGAIASRFAKQAAVMQQYNNEHQRAESLNQEVQELKERSDTRDDLLNQFQQELRNTIPKVNMAIKILKTLEPGAQRDQCLEILRQTCTHEMAVLKELPDLQDFLTPENIQLLRQLNLVSNQSEESLVIEEKPL